MRKGPTIECGVWRVFLRTAEKKSPPSAGGDRDARVHLAKEGRTALVPGAAPDPSEAGLEAASRFSSARSASVTLRGESAPEAFSTFCAEIT